MGCDREGKRGVGGTPHLFELLTELVGTLVVAPTPGSASDRQFTVVRCREKNMPREEDDPAKA